MKKLLSLLIVFVSLMAQAQIAWPPKTFPCNVPFILPAEIEYYWGIKKIICTGRSGDGYKFKVTGTGNHDHSAAQINMLYMKPSSNGGHPSGSTAGTYLFPRVEKGKTFYFDFVAAWKGRTPDRFSLFFMSEWISIPAEEPAQEQTETTTSASNSKNESTSSSSVNTNPGPTVNKKPVYEAPQYPGGKEALFAFLEKNMKEPYIAIKSAGYGTTTVEFTLDGSGNITNPYFVRRCNVRVDDEVMRLVKLMGSWKPATKDGYPCSAVMQFSMSIFPSFRAGYKVIRYK